MLPLSDWKPFLHFLLKNNKNSSQLLMLLIWFISLTYQGLLTLPCTGTTAFDLIQPQSNSLTTFRPFQILWKPCLFIYPARVPWNFACQTCTTMITVSRKESRTISTCMSHVLTDRLCAITSSKLMGMNPSSHPTWALRLHPLIILMRNIITDRIWEFTRFDSSEKEKNWSMSLSLSMIILCTLCFIFTTLVSWMRCRLPHSFVSTKLTL